MPSWWGKSSSKEVKKKGNKESFIDTLHRKFRITSEGKWTTNRKCCSDTISEQAPQSLAGSRSISPSKEVSRCQSFAERPHAQPLPLPGTQLSTSPRADSGHKASTKPGIESIARDPTPFLFLPLPKPRRLPDGADGPYAEADFGTGSVSSDMSTDSDDPSDSRLLSPQASDYENGTKTAINSPSSVKKKDRSRVATRKNSTEMVEPANIFVNNQMIPKSPKRHPLRSQRSHVSNLQIPHRGSFLGAPDSSMSSPSKSPMRASGPEIVMNSVFWAGKPCADRPLLGSGHCSSPGSGHNSGHNSIGGDMAGQIFWQHHSRCSPECSPIPSPRMTSPGPSSRIHSGAVTPLHARVGGATESLANWPECSPIPSPRMTSPGPSSRIHSGAVTPLHPRAGGVTTESHAARSDDGKQQSHRLPLPPLTLSNTCPISPSYSTGTTPIPRSPSRADNPTSPGSRWKKGRLLGRGTFGHVYLGFNSESGEMCAMKEVTLFSDDRKSKESAQQLGQEVALLSRLRHPNIVQYYGSETVDDKLYIYLEYVSGGSIYKILQDYGQLGEIAIRSYTQQILSGLAYLHAKHTLHRDIKGANILVDPHGRVKLADFGMAKHITGQSCPLSFKGSPYWMAPEVINNSSGCNLAVDIWSLGCTVLEMATTKPPWSQFEGVAAMFKIGNSKELPAIPAHLSDDGKDFVRQCLQRNPSHRPSAVQLLEHPFVRNAALLERPVLGPKPKEAIPSVTNAIRSLGIGNAKNLSHLESGVTKHHQSRRPKKISAFSDAHVPRNISCPVSPITSPLLHSRSPQHMSPRPCASQISSPPAISGSSIPLIGPKQPITYLHESVGMTSRSQNSFYPTNGMPYQDLKPEIFRGVPQASHLFRETVQSENGFPRNQFGRSAKGKGDVRELYDGQFVLTNRVSQRLLKDQKKKNPSLDLRPKSPVLIRKAGV